jgi:predicted amidohydrolase YtcJ
MDADLLLVNGNVVTFDSSSRIAEAVAIRGKRIVGVGETRALSAQVDSRTKRIDLAGRSVLPGFYDAHPHMDREGLRAYGGRSILGLRSIEEILEQVALAARNTPEGEWIVFMPMGAPPFDYMNNPKLLKEGRFPTRHDLDAVAPNHPVYIRNVWGWWSRPPYPAIANSAALKQVGITRHTADPYNIKIVRDAAGEPTGVFLETNRVSLLEYTLFRDAPRFTYQDRLNSVCDGSKVYSALGTTGGYESHGLTPALMRAYREADERGELTVRISGPLSLPTSAKSRRDISDLLYHWAAAAGGRGATTGNFRFSGVTIDHADPNISAPIAREYPYEQWAGFFSQGITASEFVEIGIEAAKLGIRLNFVIATSPPYHDTDQTIALMEQINREAPIRDLRCVGFHLNSITPDQIRRIRELGIAISLTPSFIYSHSGGLGLSRLGQDAVPISEVLHAGIPVALGSDNVPPSMLFTCWEALVRWDDEGQQHLGKSNLTREEALRICCQTPHYMNFDEDNRGRIAPGQAAELVVLNGNPLTCDVDLLPQLEADMTILDGRITHDRISTAAEAAE